MFKVVTQRLSLRHLHVLDEVPMYDIFCDPEVMRFSEGVKTHEEVRAWLHRCLVQYEDWGFGPYAVVERSSRDILGYCGLFFFPNLDDQAEVEIGYRLARSAWGKGYATEAALAIRDQAFTTLRRKRLIAMIDPGNFASIRVAEKIGMRYEKDIMLEGYSHPDHIYSMASSAWSPLNSVNGK